LRLTAPRATRWGKSDASVRRPAYPVENEGDPPVDTDRHRLRRVRIMDAAPSSF